MKDLRHSVDFGEGKRVEFSTKTITGYLESIYLSTTNPVNIIIYSLGNPDVVLYENLNFVGSSNLFLRSDTVSADGEKFNYVNTRWALNEKLGFIFKGSAFTKIEVKIRYNNG